MLIHQLIYANLLQVCNWKKHHSVWGLQSTWSCADVRMMLKQHMILFPGRLNIHATYTHPLGKNTSSSNLLARRGYVNLEGNKQNNLIMAFFLNEIILTVPFLVRLNHSPPGHVIGTNGPFCCRWMKELYRWGCCYQWQWSKITHAPRQNSLGHGIGRVFCANQWLNLEKKRTGFPGDSLTLPNIMFQNNV